jgi:hypothetical protein
MNNLKKFIFDNLIVLVILIIAALVGGFFNSYLNYYFNNLSIEKRNEEATKQLMFFIHNEIYKNYIHISQWVHLSQYYSYIDKSLLSVEGLGLIISREGNLTIKDTQLSFLIIMYIHFKDLNYKINEYILNRGSVSYDEYKKRMDACLQEIKDYEKEFCKNESLKSEIKIE